MGEPQALKGSLGTHSGSSILVCEYEVGGRLSFLALLSHSLIGVGVQLR